MNRVLGDYFETLLYKIFVSIDEHTSVAEVSSVVVDIAEKPLRVNNRGICQEEVFCYGQNTLNQAGVSAALQNENRGKNVLIG